MKHNNNPPVLILGGDTNSLSLARSFGQQKIAVYIAAKPECPAGSSKYCGHFFKAPIDMPIQWFWLQLFNSQSHPYLHGAVIFACDDEAVQFLAKHKQQLSQNFILDDFQPSTHLHMLNKQKTLQLAQHAGCEVPQNWEIKHADDLQNVPKEIPFPVMLKPIHSHEFQKHFYKKKYLLADNQQQLKEKSQLLFQHHLEFMICEVIPGPDSNLCSYYTYLDKHNEPLFHFTKRIIRRYPVNSGIGTAQITQWIPETAAMGEKFFNGIGFRGMGHVEFKRDPRDGKLKVIECNPRYSAAQEVITRSGMDMAYLVYQYLTGSRQAVQSCYRNQVRLLFPIQDAKAFWQLYQNNEIGFKDWLKSIFHRQVLPVFSWTDPIPSLTRLKFQIIKRLHRKEEKNGSGT